MSTDNKTEFQFHKVRLKDFSDCLLYTGSLFQFHKVRLKDKPHYFYYAVPEFQFHKVRLKVHTQIGHSAW